MTKEEIYNIIRNSEWHKHPVKMFAHDSEESEYFAFWNRETSFTVHAIRKTYDENENTYIWVVTEIRPQMRFSITLDDLNIDWESDNQIRYCTLKGLESKDLEEFNGIFEEEN